MNDKALTPEEFKRLMEEAQSRGEDTAPIVRRFVISTMDSVATHHRRRRPKLETRAEPD